MSDKLANISVLFEGMDVSDEQKEKFQTNLEAILSEKMGAYKAEVEAENEKVIAEKVEEEVANITEKVDDYLTYVVESWADENKLAIEGGIKLEIMESFIDGMKDLFVEHYVDVPEGKDDIVTAAEQKVGALQDDLNEEIQKNIELSKELARIKKTAVVEQASEGLTDTQKEKFAALLEDIDATDTEVFGKKVKTIRESFFKSETHNATDKNENSAKPTDEPVSRMTRYLNAL